MLMIGITRIDHTKLFTLFSTIISYSFLFIWVKYVQWSNGQISFPEHLLSSPFWTRIPILPILSTVIIPFAYMDIVPWQPIIVMDRCQHFIIIYMIRCRKYHNTQHKSLGQSTYPNKASTSHPPHSNYYISHIITSNQSYSTTYFRHLHSTHLYLK